MEQPGGMDNASPQQFETATARVATKGYGSAGWALVQNLTGLIPEATTYAVHYPASWSGCSSETKGVEDIVNNISKMAKSCPQQKYVIGGHSQGGVVTTSAVAKLNPDLLSRVLAVTMVGSPPCPASVKEKCKAYCNAGDDVSALWKPLMRRSIDILRSAHQLERQKQMVCV
jgi:pimeloyl-ACP methyl ester carboxylesterase